MSLCVSCGLALYGDRDFCPHHPTGYDEDWHIINRHMGDFVHRKWLPPQPPLLSVLRTRVAETLAAAGFPALEVDVDDFNLTVSVFLSGKVSSAEEVKRAGRITASVPGVGEVISDIAIKPPPMFRRWRFAFR